MTPVAPVEEGHHPRNWRGVFNPLPEIMVASGKGAGKSLARCVMGHRFYNHVPAYQVRARVHSGIWNSYRKFSIIRNPWDRALSQYYQVREARGLKSFDEYLDRGRLPFNLYLYTDPVDGRMLVDEVVHYDRLNEDLSVLFKGLGVPFDGTLTVRAKSGFRSSGDRERMTEEQAARIAEIFKREIELHGYENRSN